jgi:actin-related protein
MTYYARDASILVLKPGTFRTEIGSADYVQLPTLTVKTKQPQQTLWQLLFRKHGIQVELNNYATCLLVPTYWKHPQLEETIKLLFETLNVPALYLVDQSLASLFGVGIITGIVIDIGHTYTSVVCIVESNICPSATQIIEVAGKDIEKHGLGVLFNPVKQVMALHELVFASVKKCQEPFKRVQLFENIVVTGGVSENPELLPMLEKHMLSLGVSETGNEYQCKEVKFQKIPEYMTNYKKRPSEACFLGGAIVGKVFCY